MLPYLSERFGNPSGAHAVSRQARTAVEDARDVMARALGADSGEVVFTAGGTEAINLAITGSLAARPGTVVCSAVEHAAVLESCRPHPHRLVGVDPQGVVDLEALACCLDDEVALVSIMLANNEVGTVQRLSDVVAVVRRRAPRAFVHTDAVQAFPWLDVAALAADCDLVSISAHKFGGPKGVGALVARSGASLRPVLRGGSQERGRRAGTHNVAGIVGMAAAASVTAETREATVARVGQLRHRLVEGLLSGVEGARETVGRASKVAGNCHMTFRGAESEALLVLLDEAGVCASAGSACASGALEPSHVLRAIGLPEEEAGSALRLSLGYCTGDDDVDAALAVVPKAVSALRS
jgi:cysteine desulfurase